MKTGVVGFLCALALLVADVPITSAQQVLQQRAFGTIARDATVCVGPLSRSTDQGVQIFGFTNGAGALTWQVFAVSSQTAPMVLFETTARFVDQTVAPLPGNFLYHACVVKKRNAPQDFDLSLNSQAVE